MSASGVVQAFRGFLDDDSGRLDLAVLHVGRADDRPSIVTEPSAGDGPEGLEEGELDLTGAGSEETAAKVINSGVDGYV